MAVDCIFHIKTLIPVSTLNQILDGEVLGTPHFDYGEGDLEAPFHFRLSNDLHQANNDEWLEYEVKSEWTGTIYKVRGRRLKMNYSLYDTSDEVEEFQSAMIVEINAHEM